MPKVSVVMPVYNAEQYLAEAIDSILEQTFTDFEFIIIDDGSQDNSVNIVKSYDDLRIKLYQNEYNMGIAASLNRGLDLSTGKYIARMDSDDISLPERFAKQVEYLEKNTNVAVVGCGIQLFGAKAEERIFSPTHEQLKVDLLFNCCFAHPTVMFRRNLFGAGKYVYDVNYNKMEDYALWNKVSETNKLACLQDILLKYRIHSKQITQSYTQEYVLQFRRLKEYQIASMKISNEGEEFEAFISYCLGQATVTEQYVIILSSFFKKLKKANNILRFYSAKEFKGTLDSIVKGMLGQLPIKVAISLAPKCGVNIITYGLKRIGGRVICEGNKKNIRDNLKVKEFTIISNNCWGGSIYQKYGLKYCTPTVGLFISGHDFVKLCSDLQNYLTYDLEFIKWENSSLYHSLENKQPYPIAKLKDIEVYFMHYSSEQEAREKWNRRKERINLQHMLFKLSQRENCSKEDVEQFMRIPFENKICFAYDGVPGTIHVPELENLVGDEMPIIEKYFKEKTILDRL